MALATVPETAVCSFEQLHGLLVTVHDLEGLLWPFLSPDRMMHRHPLCSAVKVQHADACVRFGVDELRRDINRYTDGRVQVCHAGLVEFVYPVFDERQLIWVLFAGLRTPGKKLQTAVIDPQPRTPSAWKRDTVLPKKINDDEAALILEALRQLAARLKVWRSEQRADERARDAHPHPMMAYKDKDLAERRTLIHRFIYMRHKEPLRLADLARTLHLSESRAGHLVRDVCGATFLDLLQEARLRTAANLLRHTNLSVLDVATRSGFSEISHFHRHFKRRFGVSPLQYRKQPAT